MAPKRPSLTDKFSAADVVERALPEWRLATPDVEPDFTADANAMKIDQGLSIARLRQKFGVLDSGPGEPDFAPVDASIETVRIEPKSGGPAKTADIDIKTGKVTIVQG